MTKEEEQLNKRDLIYLIALLEDNKKTLLNNNIENEYIDDINEINKIDEILIKLEKIYKK
jgi:hypothetical protein